MGQAVCSGVQRFTDRKSANDDHYGDFVKGENEIYMLVCALDYPGTSAPLTCTADANNMMALAQASGVTNITYMKNSECHLDAVTAAIKRVAGMAQAGDFFIFFYAGHGANIPDDDGDEADGQDEALCLVTPSGDIDYDKFMRDDDFAELISGSCEQGVNILIMCDCCHSGTIGDFKSPCWEGHTAISMSGCKDSQTSGDTGKGGIWTHSCLIAVQAMADKGVADYSCAQLYNLQLKYDDEVFNSEQDIRMHCTDGLDGPEHMTWPLVPVGPYKAPWNAQ